MKYKVLSLASWYPNPTDVFDGDFVQRHVEAIATQHEVVQIHILNDDSGKFKDQPLLIRKVHSDLTEYTYFIQKSRTGFRAWDSWVNNRRYLKQGKEAVERILEDHFTPDLIHAHISIKSGLLARKLKKKWQVPLVLTEHWTIYLKPLGFKMKYFSKKVWKNVDRLLPVSENLAQHIQKVFPVPYTVVPNVVNTDRFYLKEENNPNPPFVFFHVSTLNENKNPEGLFRVIKQLADQKLPFVLKIAGQNQEKYKELCQEWGIPNQYIEFIGLVSYTKIAEQMQSSNAFVLFSNFENLPCVLLESLCCGLPIITTDAGGCGEIVNPENGILIDRKDEKALLEAMKKMIANPELYNTTTIAEQAQAKYSYSAVANAYTAVYESLVMFK